MVGKKGAAPPLPVPFWLTAPPFSGIPTGTRRGFSCFDGTGCAIPPLRWDARPAPPMLKATLEIVLFLLSGIAMAAAKVAALTALALAVPVAGVLLWRRRRK